MSERICDHGTAPLRTCELCLCQSKSREFQCELDPHHDSAHHYYGGLEDEFAITWDRCLDVFLGIGVGAVRCDLERGHEGLHKGVRLTDTDVTSVQWPLVMGADDATDPT